MNDLLESARALVEEIREHGTHQCWKLLAAAVDKAGSNGQPFALALIDPSQPTDWPKNWMLQFWDCYPRRIGKADAQRKLDAIRKGGKVPFQKILDAVMVYRAETQNTEMQYIAHPATWLNRGRWEDDPNAITGKDDGCGKINNGFLGRLMNR